MEKGKFCILARNSATCGKLWALLMSVISCRASRQVLYCLYNVYIPHSLSLVALQFALWNPYDHPSISTAHDIIFTFLDYAFICEWKSCQNFCSFVVTLVGYKDCL